MQTGYSGCLRQGLVSLPSSNSTTSGKNALIRHQFGTNRALYKHVQSLGSKPAKQRFSRLNVSATKDLPLPVILDRDFDKEGSRVYKRTVRNRVATQPQTATSKKQSTTRRKLLLACRFSPSVTGLRTGAPSAMPGTYTPLLGWGCLLVSHFRSVAPSNFLLHMV